jgi:hypothetical protein
VSPRDRQPLNRQDKIVTLRDDALPHEVGVVVGEVPGDERKHKSGGSQDTKSGDRDLAEQSRAEFSVKEPSEEEIDLNLIGSFPASDPPSWTLGVARTTNASISRRGPFEQ